MTPNRRETPEKDMLLDFKFNKIINKNRNRNSSPFLNAGERTVKKKPFT
jgi:hypothetical protein